MFKHTLYLMVFLLSLSCFAQDESAVWYFGEYAGVDFNSGAPIALTDGQLNTKEGCATICDPNGNLLFYTDGTTVWNQDHDIMSNGTDLLGDISSTASAIIIPKPGETNIYYIFTVDMPGYFLNGDDPITGLNYSKVDMNLNNGLVDVVDDEKNIHLVTYNPDNPLQNEFKCSEKISAVTHGDGSSVWVITHFMNRFYAFLVDQDGVNPEPVVSSTPTSIPPILNDDDLNITAIGYLKVSPDGEKIAIAHSSTQQGTIITGQHKSGKVFLYDFDNLTGAVSDQQELVNEEYPYGVEFSPNSELLYITSGIFDEDDEFSNSFIYQFNTEANDVPASKTIISDTQNVAGALQLAIDGKIYRSGYPVGGNGYYLSVINNPDELGAACDYSHNSVFLDDRLAFLGLPPFIQSIFRYTFDYENDCAGEDTHFFVTSEDPYDTLLWDFGDGNTSTEADTFHNYQNAGIYNVSLILTVNGVDYDPMVKQIVISEPPEVMQNAYELVQCDAFDNNPNDGISTFNLENANGPLSLNTSENIDVYYYHSYQEAMDDVDNTNALDNIYTNQTNNEILHAKVFKANTSCFNMATVELVTTPSADLDNFNLTACNYDNANTATFDLDEARQEIINTLNLPGNVMVSFHEYQNQAAIGINELEDEYVSGPRTLYVRAESDNVCYGSGTLELSLSEFPNVEDQTLMVCPTEFPVEINSGIASEFVSEYNYQWSTNQTTEQININETGTYQVTISDLESNCTKTIGITVEPIATPHIEDILINDTMATIILNEASNNVEFALDDASGSYQNSNVFTSITPGSHTIYVRDLQHCHLTSIDFEIIGFPKFFTPNDDTNNDYWNIKGLDPVTYPNVEISIFDRYGKLIYTFNPNQSNGWDGRYNGEISRPDDYWYYLKLPSGKEYRGHFTLKI